MRHCALGVIEISQLWGADDEIMDSEGGPIGDPIVSEIVSHVALMSIFVTLRHDCSTTNSFSRGAI